MFTQTKENNQTKVAAIQMCSSHVLEENLITAEKLIREAAKNDAKLIVLPEMFAIMGLKPTDKVNVKEKYQQGKIQNFLSEQAKINKVWVVGGTIPIACENDETKVRATCLVYNDYGIVVARYDKIHLFDVVISDKEAYKESETTEPGNNLVVVDTPVGKLGLAVCYDIRFPEQFRYLFNQGAEIIALPSAFTVKTGESHWELLTRSRAVENFCYLIGACQGGTHSSGRKTYGNSLIVDPWGDLTSKNSGVEPGIIYSSIDLEYQKKIRTEIPVKSHQRIFFDLTDLASDNIIKNIISKK